MSSGKFVLRLDPHMHAALKAEARAKGESLNSLCLHKLQGLNGSPWREIVSQIASKIDPIGIVLFGSTARGEATSTSDIDLLIVLSEATSITRSRYRDWDHHFQRQESYSPQFTHLPKESSIGSLWLEASIDGEILYDPKGEIKKTLQNIRRLISEGKYQRKMNNGHSYWKEKDSDAK